MIYTRAQWGAKPPLHQLNGYSPPFPLGIAWHYIGGTQGSFNPANHDGCLTWVRDLQTREMQPGGKWQYSDLSYNLCVCPHGDVIEGRGVHYQSGAQLGGNDQWLGVLIMLDVGEQITPAFQRGASSARDYVLSVFPDATKQVGHRDVAGNPTGTQCPGPAIEAWIAAGGAQPFPQPEDDLNINQLVMLRADKAITAGDLAGKTPTVIAIEGTPLAWELDNQQLQTAHDRGIPLKVVPASFFGALMVFPVAK